MDIPKFEREHMHALLAQPVDQGETFLFSSTLLSALYWLLKMLGAVLWLVVMKACKTFGEPYWSLCCMDNLSTLFLWSIGDSIFFFHCCQTEHICHCFDIKTSWSICRHNCLAFLDNSPAFISLP